MYIHAIDVEYIISQIIYMECWNETGNDKLFKYATGGTAAKQCPRGQNRCGTMRGTAGEHLSKDFTSRSGEVASKSYR